MPAPTERTNLRDYAIRESRRRAKRVGALALPGFMGSVPEGIFHRDLNGLGLMFGKIAMVADETGRDIRAAQRGDPLVMCGRVHPRPEGWYDELAEEMVHTRTRAAFTFGYCLEIDVVWAGRIAPDGCVIEAVDRMGNDQTVPSTRRISRRATPGADIVLLCNSEGTALADGAEIPDPVLVRWLRDFLANHPPPDPPREQ